MLVRSTRKLLVALTFAVLCILWSRHISWTHSGNVYHPLAFLKSVRPSSIENVTAVQAAAQGLRNVEKPKPTPTGPPWLAFTSEPVPYRKRPSRLLNMNKYMQDMLNWGRPTWEGHWPPFGDYIGKGYDPNRWEEFKLDYRPYHAGHHRMNRSVSSSPHIYSPFPQYNSPKWRKQWKGDFVPCIGPRGLRLNESVDDLVQVFPGVPHNFPTPFVGGYDIIGLDGNACFDRYSRYGPYGAGPHDFPENVTNWRGPDTIPNWNQVNWGKLQDRCLKENENRFHPDARELPERRPTTHLPTLQHVVGKMHESVATITDRSRQEKGPKYRSRSAVLIRTWTGYAYQDNDIKAIRAMISELALQSGGEYQVFLFVHVKDRNLPIFEDPEVYNQVVRDNVPPELRDMTILWSESVFPTWYPEVTDWQVYWHQFMCVQWFILTHPEFDFVWNWETDARYIGHHYHFFEKVAEFADNQPRKLLWERNKRYYMPAVHGSYKSFIEQTHSDVLNASAHSLIPPPVWGARPYPRAVPAQKPLGPTPPRFFGVDKFEWGVGEPADFITLLPIWDPRNTSWSYKDKIWNYIPTVHPLFTPQDGQADWFTHPDFAQIDRRVFINTVGRFSKRMLLAMHNENEVGRSMQAEMWPSTVALQHGLKAVYAPHPIFNDRHWPAPYAQGIFDAQSKIDPVTAAPIEEVQGAWTEQADSPYNHDREFNFQGFSWYYASRFPRMLYRRWLGWKISMQDWGAESRIEGGPGSDGPGEEKRMCLPGMLLHPIKNMDEDRIEL